MVFPLKYILDILTTWLQDLKSELLPCIFSSYHLLSSCCWQFCVFPEASKQKKITAVW